MGSVTGIIAQAQEQTTAPNGPAPVLMTVREIVRPGAETAHAKLEVDFLDTFVVAVSLKVEEPKPTTRLRNWPPARLS